METPIGAFILSFLVTALLARGMLRWAPRWSLTDAPSDRKPHRGQMPLGGLALVLTSFWVATLLGWPWTEIWGWGLLGALAVSLLGLLDDRWNVSPMIKLVGQVAAALLPILLGGFVIESVGAVGLEIELGVFAVPFTLLWIVGVTNALNLIDGLDGLSLGAVLVACSATALFSIESANEMGLLISATLIGASAGFLLLNFHPARLFLGDGGSYFLGFTLSLLTVLALAETPQASLQEAPMLVPVALLFYPIADTLWAIARRAKAGRPIFQADQGHFHHQLLQKELGYLKTVFTFYGVFVALALLATALFFATR